MISKKSILTDILRRFTCFVFIVLFTFSPYSAVYGQDIDSSTTASSETSAQENNDAGPSLLNLKKTGAAATEETKRIEEENRMRQILDIVYMIVGFAIVITGAWYLASWARKQELKKEEEKRVRVEKALLRKGYTLNEDGVLMKEKKETDTSDAEIKTPPKGPTRKPSPRRPPARGRRR